VVSKDDTQLSYTLHTSLHTHHGFVYGVTERIMYCDCMSQVQELIAGIILSKKCYINMRPILHGFGSMGNTNTKTNTNTNTWNVRRHLNRPWQYVELCHCVHLISSPHITLFGVYEIHGMWTQGGHKLLVSQDKNAAVFINITSSVVKRTWLQTQTGGRYFE
jgi:hypothetical protein